MSSIFISVLNMSIAASWLILAVMAGRVLLKKAPKWSRCLLWALAGIRLVSPISIKSVLSLVPSGETIPKNIMLMPSPAIDSGISSVDAVINPAVREAFSPHPWDSANPLQIMVPLLALIWSIGIAVMLLCALCSYWKLRKNVAASIPWEHTGALAQVYKCDDIDSPFILGIARPRIYVPSGLEGTVLDSVIAHENAHIARKDHWWKPLGYLILAFHWFNPLVWAAYILLCKDIELACDERVIRDLNRDSIADYSQALLSCSTRRNLVNACPLAFGEVSVKRRIKGVLSYKKPGKILAALALVLCFAVGIFFMTDPVSAGSGEFENKGISAPEEAAAGTEEQQSSDLERLRENNPVIVIKITDAIPEGSGLSVEEVIQKYLTVSLDGKDVAFKGSDAPVWLQEVLVVGPDDPVPDKEITVVKNVPYVMLTSSWVWPVESTELTSTFGERYGTQHSGVDIRADKGDDVKAVSGGKVISAGWESGYGYTVRIEHAAEDAKTSLKTVYAHLSEISVEEGQTVKPGDLIGKVGSTGNSTGPHLHFEVQEDGVAVDPMGYYLSE